MPWLRNRVISAWAAVASFWNVVPASGREEFLVLSAMVRPIMPIFCPSRSTTVEAFTGPPASAELVANLTLALSTGVLQLPAWRKSMNFLRPASVLSNSWLPSVNESKQTVFIMSASALPSFKLKYRSPVTASPACIFRTLGVAAARDLMAEVTRAKPPYSTSIASRLPAAVIRLSLTDSASRWEWWSLTCRIVRDSGLPSAVGCGFCG